MDYDSGTKRDPAATNRRTRAGVPSGILRLAIAAAHREGEPYSTPNDSVDASRIETALFSLLGAFDEAPIEALLKQFADFNALSRTLIVTSTNITTRAATAFYAFVGAASSNQSGFPTKAGLPTAPISELNYVDVLEASAAIPGAFTPIEMNLGSNARSCSSMAE